MDEIDPNCLPPLPIPELRDPSKPLQSVPSDIDRFDVTNANVPARIKCKYFLKHIAALPWHLVVGRTDIKNMRQVRVDLVSGLGTSKVTYIPSSQNTFTVNSTDAEQLAHFHPLSPAWAEGSKNSEIHAHFFHQSHQLIKDLMKELDEKDEEITILKENNNVDRN